jgi:hypothetical protein
VLRIYAQVLKVLKDFLGHKALRVHRDLKVFKEPQEVQQTQVPLVLQDLQVLQDLKVHRVHRVQPDMQVVFEVLQASRVQQVHKGFREVQQIRGLLGQRAQ